MWYVVSSCTTCKHWSCWYCMCSYHNTTLSPQIPRSLVSHYCELVSANPRSRPSPSDLLASLRQHGGFLSNPFVAFSLRLEELQVRVTSSCVHLLSDLHMCIMMCLHVIWDDLVTYTVTGIQVAHHNCDVSTCVVYCGYFRYVHCYTCYSCPSDMWISTDQWVQ